MANQRYFHPDTDYFNKVLDAPPPVATPHVTEEEARLNMKQLKPNSWRMEGPGKLVGDTEMGKLTQFIDPSYICEGTDDKGLPILTKIKL